MRDQHVGQISRGFEAAQKTEYLFLSFVIKTRCGFVEDNQLRIQDQRSGNRKALALASAKRQRLARKHFLFEPCFQKKPLYYGSMVFLVDFAMDQQRFGDKFFGGKVWIERRRRILQN